MSCTAPSADYTWENIDGIVILSAVRSRLMLHIRHLCRIVEAAVLALGIFDLYAADGA